MTDLLHPSVERPDFEEPWQSEAFALVVSLNRAGQFSWQEWVDRLSEEIAADTAVDRRRTYYQQWLAALEHLLTAKGLIDEGERTNRQQAWHAAYLTTPHGKEVLLDKQTATNN